MDYRHYRQLMSNEKVRNQLKRTIHCTERLMNHQHMYSDFNVRTTMTYYYNTVMQLLRNAESSKTHQNQQNLNRQ